MTATAELEEEAAVDDRKVIEASALELDDQRLDRIYIATDTPSVDRFIVKMKHRLHEDENGDLFFSIRNAYIANAVAHEVKGKFKEQLPDWMRIATTESKYATDAYYNDQAPVAWGFADLVILSCKFTFTLALRIAQDMRAPSYYSEAIGGWIFLQDDIGNDISTVEQIVKDYGFDVSPHFYSVLEGGSAADANDWKAIIEPTEKKAYNEGFADPRSLIPEGQHLEEHQAPAISVMAYQGMTLLADQVGLGKTVEFLCGALTLDDYLATYFDDTAYPVVVVSTTTMTHTLISEIHTWNPSANVELLEGKARGPIDDDVDFIVIGMSILKDRLEDILEAQPRGLILDEAHNYKTMEAQRTQAAMQIADAVRENSGDCAYIVCVSGTPFVNRPSELWTLLNILGWADDFVAYAEQKLGKDSRARIKTRSGMRSIKISKKMLFEKRWCGGFADKYGTWQNKGSSNREELHRLLCEAGMIRRKKSDVINPLPELQEHVVKCNLSLEDQHEYKKVQEQFRRWATAEAKRIAEEDGVSAKKAVQLMQMKLKSNEPIMKMTAERQAVGKGKVQAVIDRAVKLLEGDLDNAGDPMRRKVVIYAYHKDVQRAIREAPELQKYGVASIQAGRKVTGGDDIDDVKRRFQAEDGGVRVMVLTMEAREGHTLTAASDVFLAEIPFVPSWTVQMAGRCWARFSREYKPHGAHMHFFVCPDTIDISLMKMNKLKKIDFNAVIDGIDMPEDEQKQVESDSGFTVFLDHVHELDAELGIAS